MKLPIFTVVALLAASSTGFADNGRTFFGDGSPENTYIAGQQNARPTDNSGRVKYHIGHTNNKKAYRVGRTIFGDGSVENSYIAGQHESRPVDDSNSVKYHIGHTNNKKAYRVGRTIFGDGSVENSYIAGK